MRSAWAHTTILAVVVLCGNVSSGFAQVVPWDVFSDHPVSDSVCDVVNAGNLEVVVLSDTGELVVVTDEDYALDGAALVSVDGIFYFEGIPLGQVAFADDGDGFRTVWLLDLGDNVLELDPDTGEPIFTNLFPDDFVDVPCDAFELWDDDDLDGVLDDFDFCPETPPGEPVDECGCIEADSDNDGLDDCHDECPLVPGDYAFGCPCDVFDEDDDDINDCIDDCSNTSVGAVVDEHGCEIVVVVVPDPVVITCGNFSTLTLDLTFGTLVTLRLGRRRHW